MKDLLLTASNLEDFFNEIQLELAAKKVLHVTTSDGKTGNWGMARLWRSWMSTTGKFMAEKGKCTMPLMLRGNGEHFGERPFNENDAHELFTSRWLGLDIDGKRLSWAKKGHSGMRPATKGERFNAMLKHEQWASERGITLFKPRESEYAELEREQDA
ncbi:MAG: hypothetical protein V3W52_17100 [Syntrophobacteria bacterium]